MSQRKAKRPRPVLVVGHLGDVLPDYLERVLALGGDLGAGVHHVTVSHDHDCPKLHGGRCACDALVEYAGAEGL